MSDVSSLFSSKRERRLWTWALVLVVTIYLTLGLTAKLVGQVNEVVLGVTFFACLILVGVTILTQGLSVRPGGIEIGIGVGIAVVYVLLGVRMAIPERSHLMEYGILAVIVYEALIERLANDRHVPLPGVCAFAATSLAGVLDECIQAILPGRVFDWRDIVFNTLAALAAVIGMVLLRWARRRTKTFLHRTPNATEQTHASPSMTTDCQRQPNIGEVTMNQDEQAIQKWFDNWMTATKEGDLELAKKLIADDAIFLVPGAGQMDKESFAAAATATDPNTEFELDCSIQEIRVFGDHAWLLATISLAMTDKNTTARSMMKGDSLSVLHKRSDGWVVVRDANTLVPVETDQ